MLSAKIYYLERKLDDIDNAIGSVLLMKVTSLKNTKALEDDDDDQSINDELLQEAMDFVNNLHTVRPYDSTWDEYMQYVLENSRII